MSTPAMINLTEQIKATLGQYPVKRSDPTLIINIGWDRIAQKMWERRHTVEDRALLVMLLTGCRVSELNSVKILNIRGSLIVNIDCKKQHVCRLLHVTQNSVLPELLPITPGFMVSEVTQKQISRYIKRNYQEIIPGEDFTGHKACHVMRYMYIAILAECIGMDYETITKIMHWSDEELVEQYLKYLLYITATLSKKNLISYKAKHNIVAGIKPH